MSKQTTRSRNKTKAAADVLSDLATPIPEGGKPGLPDPDPITAADGKRKPGKKSARITSASIIGTQSQERL